VPHAAGAQDREDVLVLQRRVGLLEQRGGAAAIGDEKLDSVASPKPPPRLVVPTLSPGASRSSSEPFCVNPLIASSSRPSRRRRRSDRPPAS
jgi:hypothetical protein